MLLVYARPVMRAVRCLEGGYSGLDLCLLGQEDLEFPRLLLADVDVGVDP